MTKLKFIINFVFLGAIFILACIFSGNTLMLYTDIASLILGILIPYIVISFIYSPSEQIALCGEVLKRGDTFDDLLLKRALVFLKAFKKLLIYSGVVWSLMGAISIGVHLEGPDALGMNFGVLMIVPLYVSLFLIMFVEPLRATAEKKLN